MASRYILRALSGTTVEDRRQIENRARRETVSTLVRLAWNTASFYDAILALALLAEAENETWGNNASEEFVSKFNLYLSGTAVPYCDRLLVIDDIRNMGRSSLMRLVIRALAQISNRQFSRIDSGPASDELPELEWKPGTNLDYLTCIEQALSRLSEIASVGNLELRDILVKTANDLATMLRIGSVRNLVIRFFDSVHKGYPDAREDIRRSISNVLHQEKMYIKELSADDLSQIESLHTRFESDSMEARLLQHVGQSFWDQDERPNLVPLARELSIDTATLSEQWPWLTSGEAAEGWLLGEALAMVDQDGNLDFLLSTLPGARARSSSHLRLCI